MSHLKTLSNGHKRSIMVSNECVLSDGVVDPTLKTLQRGKPAFLQ